MNRSNVLPNGSERVFGPSPAILGHRGCGRGTVDGLLENTFESFLAAVQHGVDWLEVDVRRTSDDLLVVAHNPADDDGVFYADITGHEASDRGSLRLEELLEALPPGSVSTSTSRPRWRTRPASATAPPWDGWPLSWCGRAAGGRCW
jgi:glycerophosphoryl diester phosphodiesterase